MKTLSSILLALCVGTLAARGENSKVTITIQDKVTGQLMPGRIHLKDPAGKPVQAPGLPYWRDHFVCPGEVQLELAAGTYRYEVERGPEYSAARGSVTVMSGPTNVIAKLERLADMKKEGWWSGETHVHRTVADAELLMRAEDLHVAQFITWWRNRQGTRTLEVPAGKPLHAFDGDRFYHVLAGEDERDGGALLYFNLEQPLDMSGAGAQAPSSVVYAREAHMHAGVWIDMEKPFWWDFPLWVASGQCDSVGLANNHMNRSGMMDNEAWGKARDRERLPDKHGNGLWSQEIYYQVLNCGLRIPPSAGSASGVLPNPVGYNRVYVHVDGPLTYEKWWEGLRAGRSFVSNGPLLRCRVNGELPGKVFKGANRVELEIEALLSGRDTVAALEIIRNGRVERTVPVKGGLGAQELGKVTFTESGWLLVRAVATDPETFRFASTAPYYVEIGAGKPRVSKASAQFFVDWVTEGMKRITVPDGPLREGVLQEHRAAEKFWRDILGRANAE